MGSGIAQVVAQAGFNAIQFDVSAEMLSKSRSAIEKNLQSQVDKGKIDAVTKQEVLRRIVYTADLNDCRAEVIIEAIVEEPSAKIDLFNQLAPINQLNAIFASNTSSISISSLAAKINNPARVIGMHFFNPAYIMKLVEVVQGKDTDPIVCDAVVELARRMGKTPVICKDVPGFIVNRVARPYYLEALRLLESGVADAETIDEIMEATGFKMGPFKLMDLIGLDINYNVSTIVYEALGRPDRLKPSSLQKQKTVAGELGRKTGKGFYKY